MWARHVAGDSHISHRLHTNAPRTRHQCRLLALVCPVKHHHDAYASTLLVAGRQAVLQCVGGHANSRGNPNTAHQLHLPAVLQLLPQVHRSLCLRAHCGLLQDGESLAVDKPFGMLQSITQFGSKQCARLIHVLCMASSAPNAAIRAVCTAAWLVVPVWVLLVYITSLCTCSWLW